jgi:protein-disulfide isomerase
MQKSLFLVLPLALFLAACGDKAPDTLSQNQTEQVKTAVRDLLATEPKLVINAIEAYQKQARDEASENTKKSIASKQQEIFNNPASPIMGNPNGDVTVVEFFDYNCGYCKAVFHPIRDAVLQDGKVKFIFKEYPILGDSSLLAAKAALAAGKQGKYLEYHTALMDWKAPKDEAAIMSIAKSLGLNEGQLRIDMNSADITQYLESVRNLGLALGVNGTPAFIIGDKFYPGALDADSFKKLVADVRQAKAAPAVPAAQ